MCPEKDQKTCVSILACQLAWLYIITKHTQNIKSYSFNNTTSISGFCMLRNQLMKSPNYKQDLEKIYRWTCSKGHGF